MKLIKLFVIFLFLLVVEASYAQWFPTYASPNVCLGSGGEEKGSDPDSTVVIVIDSYFTGNLSIDSNVSNVILVIDESSTSEKRIRVESLKYKKPVKIYILTFDNSFETSFELRGQVLMSIDYSEFLDGYFSFSSGFIYIIEIERIILNPECYNFTLTQQICYKPK